LNALEPHFEGLHKWVNIDESEYEANKDKNKGSAQCYKKLEAKGKKKHIISHMVFFLIIMGLDPIDRLTKLYIKSNIGKPTLPSLSITMLVKLLIMLIDKD
jgi:hypothetical protein